MLQLSRLCGAVLAVSLCGCSAPLSAPECNELLDRYTEKLVQQKNDEASSESVFRMQREARARASRDPEFAQCANKVSRRGWECAMKAPTVDEMERCLL